MKLLVNLTLILIACTSSYSQIIDMKMSLLGYRFEQDGQRVSWSQLENQTQSNALAYSLVKKANMHRKISGLAAFVGGFLIGIPIGQQHSMQREPNWTLAYIGGGISAIGIPFSFSAFNNANRGIDKYNEGLIRSTGYHFNPTLTPISNSSGLGLSLKF
ncbi:MAG: hypothetical protein RLZZ241_662 [Bacteroidota bacterium]